MVRKIRRTTSSKSRNTGSPTPVRKNLGTNKDNKGQEEDEWGPLTSLAKKAAKGAVKGAAKELHKK